MNKPNALSTAILTFSLALLVGACGETAIDLPNASASADGGMSGYPTEPGDPEPDPWSGSADAGAAYAADASAAPPMPGDPGVTEGEGEGNGQVPTGVLTAGSIDDHLNPEIFDAFLQHAEPFAKQGPALDTRAQIRVENQAGAPLNNAVVRVRSTAGVLLLEARTGTDGRTVFIPGLDADQQGGDSFAVEATLDGGQSTSASFSLTEATWTLTLDAPATQATKLDLAFVVDTTGSMSDELEFLKAETANISAKVAASHPGVDIRFALIVYRDQGDAYVTKSYGFSNLAGFQQALGKQGAGGGGDTPEAMHQALTEAAHDLQWRTEGDVARMAFLLADAPPHDAELGATFTALDDLRRAGVRLYPVASSGVADMAEFVMRAGAFITLARYIFLTDDSGVGNPHAEPHKPAEPTLQPCYVIEKLEVLMPRMIASELAGKLVSPEQADVLRVVGNPVDGVCKQDQQPTTPQDPDKNL